MKLSKAEYEERERAVNEFVENAAGTSLEELHRSTNKLQQEIHTLDAMSRTKEQEWNNIIRLKKVKEEMYLRLQRKKQVMLIMMGASTKSGDTLEWDLTSDTRYGGDFGGCEDLRTNKNKVSDSSIASLSKFITNRQREQQGFTSHYPPQNPSSTSGVSVLKGGQQLMMVPIVSSSPGNLTRSLSISSSPFPSQSTSGALRVPDVNGKDKNGAGRGQRPILPKPTMLIPATSSANNNNNGQNPVIGEGRQGPILDVRSIIADFRSRHPETVPRRGRRMRGGLSPTPNCQMPENLVSSTRVSGSGGILSMASLALGSGSQMRTSLVGSTSELGDLSFLMSSNGEGLRQDTSRPSSTDSSRSGAQQGQPASEPGPGGGGISFKDVLVQFAKMSQAEQRHENLPPTTATVKPPPYPEVTLHPVLTPQSPPHQSPSSSLLHGILTKSTTAAQHRAEANLGSKPATFSPTLARLLTAPERLPSNIITNVPSTFHGVGQVSINDLLTTSKGRTADEDATGTEMLADDVPECQGCHQRAAQFVCAGCGNQWYCSRDCQVNAWEDHSEVCSG
uniref:MYND-type domain-containing protein n=1 Tax=Timema monikensis TaxID=170555 RepID=A0A7R9EF37_9NEOP|nr:unnamed protein product [Timema monikensis]